VGLQRRHIKCARTERQAGKQAEKQTSRQDE
jgi:hypothetical protein